MAMEEAALTFALSHVDQKELQSLQIDNTYSKNDHNITVLIPPLRDDFLQLVKLVTTSYYPRKYLLFSARFSLEKNVLHYDKIMKKLSDKGLLAKWNVTPLLIGSVCDDEYAKLVRSILPVEAKIINNFLQPEELLFYLK